MASPPNLRPDPMQPDGMHHLAKVNGVWCARWTVQHDGKLMGDRVKVSLGTGDAELARKHRNLIFRALKESGVEIATPSRPSTRRPPTLSEKITVRIDAGDSGHQLHAERAFTTKDVASLPFDEAEAMRRLMKRLRSEIQEKRTRSTET